MRTHTGLFGAEFPLQSNEAAKESGGDQPENHNPVKTHSYNKYTKIRINPA